MVHSEDAVAEDIAKTGDSALWLDVDVKFVLEDVADDNRISRVDDGFRS